MGIKLPVELKGLGLSIIIGVLFCTLVSLTIYYTGLKETLINPLSKAVLLISVFSGACYVSKAHGNKGLVRGISMGIAFFTLMFITTLIASPTHIYLKGFMYTLLACVLSGGIGGILGIGLSNN